MDGRPHRAAGVILRAAERFRSGSEGVESAHCFSAGGHYDPANVAFGPVIGLDEHVVAPGGGFARHAHRGVVIVSHVVSGVLRHEGDDGTVLLVRPGESLVQATGRGVHHAETNGGGDELRFVQVTVLADDDTRAVHRATSPVTAGGVTVVVGAASGSGVVLVTSGTLQLGDDVLHPGDSARGQLRPGRLDGGAVTVVTGDAHPR